MSQCTRCHADLTAGSRFCSQCGASSAGSSEAATVALAQGTAPRWSATSGVEEGRFPPGTLLGQRYRLLGLLGKGGMGEVHKATDLLVGQTVALKFLPESLAANEAMLERFRSEVRLARQVSHPNVCRVYDLGEAEGQLYLSMEFIDGEDLASLLRRIGQMAQPKALEMARKLCAGLAAAHEKGVLHRDFKPANIMVDARGQVLITDFGLAAAAGHLSQSDIRSGTPAYMAPEQLAGKEVTPRSDIYALGLVLYEMCVGRRPFEAESWEDLGRKQQAGPPPMKGVDPAVEHAIGRCLHPDPRRRPASALAVAAALPGGDPLQAALAAGETPSPEMVAAAGETEAMNPKLALACFGALLVGLVALAWVSGRGWAFASVASEIPPDAMAQRARDVMAHVGYADKPAGSDWGYFLDQELLERLAGVPLDEARRQIAGGHPPPVSFWYRRSPERLVQTFYANRHVYPSDPPVDVPGMVSIRLDPQGHLWRLRATPPADQPGEAAPPYEWKRLFEGAGLDAARFAPAPPRLTPLQAFDQAGAWLEQGGPLRVEAAAWRGRPVWFLVTQENSAGPLEAAVQARIGSATAAGTLFVAYMTVATCILAWRNLRLGRGDPRGAWTLAGAIALLNLAVYLLEGRHAFDQDEWPQLVRAIGPSLFEAVTAAAAYLAFEPFLRRRWPDVLISWRRALGGAVRDPLVGRHLLIGLALGACSVAVFKVHDLVYGPASQGARTVDLYCAAGAARIAAEIARAAVKSLGIACWMPFLLFVCAALLRRRWLATLGASLLWTVVLTAGSAHPLLTAAAWLVIFGTAFFVLFRYGLLAASGGVFVWALSGILPLTLDTSSWYFGASLAGLAVLAAMGYYAARTATAGQRIFSGE